MLCVSPAENRSFIVGRKAGEFHLTQHIICIQSTGIKNAYTNNHPIFFVLQVEYVLHYFGISHCVGFGVGLGANILVRLARRRPTMIDGLILINCNSQNAGWVEWVYNKINMKSLRKQLRQQQTGKYQLFVYILSRNFFL